MAGVFIYSENNSLAMQMLSLGLELVDGMEKNVCAITFNQQDAERLGAVGADKIYILKKENSYPENYARVIAEHLRSEDADLFIVGASARGRDLAARVAGYLKTSFVSETQNVRYCDEGIETQRLMYGGAVLCTEILPQMSVISVAPGKYPPAEAKQDQIPQIITIEVDVKASVFIKHTEANILQDTDITLAERVIGAGRGIEKQEDMKMLEKLAAVIGAELGCTRSIAEECHWLPVESYIGISGQSIKPQLYISVGISGQIQHVVGIRDSKIIVAIDTNEDAPIMKAADYGVVGDLYEIVPLLAEALK